MAITKDQFTWLYINATCLAELALYELANNVTKATPEGNSSEALTTEVDFGSVENWIGDSDGEFDLEKLLAAESELLSKQEPSTFTKTAGENKKNTSTDISEADPIDLQSYLANAYNDFKTADEIASETELNKRKQVIETLLGNMPKNAEQLCSRLSEQELKYWLDFYQSDDSTIAKLVAEMRSLQ